MGDLNSSRGGAAGDLRAARWVRACLGAAVVGALAGLGLPEFSSNSQDSATIQQATVVDIVPLSQAGKTASIPSPVAADASVASKRHTGKLANFYNALAGLEAGTARSPVTVLHLGDSHIASETITREVGRLTP